MNFATLQGLTIPEGVVTQIAQKSDGKVLWSAAKKYNYVSLGDSIAAGHRIDENWETDYGWNSQYGRDGRTKTEIVPNCYTDRIGAFLKSVYGEGNVDVKSFAVSGSVVKYKNSNYDPRSLFDVIDDEPVNNALKKANLVTICIGANDVLSPATDFIANYINTGDLTEFESIVNDNIKILKGDVSGISYINLFDKLKSINPNAKYVFTTVYNPYKYLWVSKGTWDKEYSDSFLDPVLRYIPKATTLGVQWDLEIKKYLLNSVIGSRFFDRINNLNNWGEKYVSLLNDAIRHCISKYADPHFVITDTKSLFDTIPDRNTPYSDNLHYNDLVNVEFTKGFDISEMDWGALWQGNIITDKEGKPISNTVCNDPATFWNVLLSAYGFSLTNFDGDTNGLMETLINQVLTKVIEKDVDPHPEIDGQYLMYRSFMDTLGWQSLNTVVFNANGGTGTMSSQKVMSESLDKAIYSVINNTFTPATGYYPVGWKDQNGNGYSFGQAIRITSDTTLYAQWNNEYVVQYYKFTEVLVDDYNNHTGHMELRSLTINGATRTDLNTAFAAKPTKDNRCSVTVRYGDKITIHTHCKPAGWDGGLWFKEHNCNLTYPGGSKTGTDITWTFDWNLINPQKNRNIIIDYQWFYQANTDLIQRWFSWWDCHVKIE